MLMMRSVSKNMLLFDFTNRLGTKQFIGHSEDSIIKYAERSILGYWIRIVDFGLENLQFVKECEILFLFDQIGKGINLNIIADWWKI